MILTESDAASLASSLQCWEVAEYSFAALVAFACAGEYVAEFTNWFTGGIKERKDALAKRSTLLLVFALALELVCLVKTNSVSGKLIGSLSDKADNASRKSQSAIDKSSVAASKADAADVVSGEAQRKADAASKIADDVQGKSSQIVEALKQPTFSDAEINALADRLRECPGHHKKVVVIGAMFNPATMSVYRGLTEGGFDNVAPPTLTAYTWQGSWVEAPQTVDGVGGGCIQQAIGDSRKLVFGLFKPWYPATDPIRVYVGLNPMGRLPEFTTRRKGKQAAEENP
jgi:hypothetical protein